MAGSEQFVVTTGGDTVLVDMDPNMPDTVAEEVVIDPSGGSSESVHYYQCQQEGLVEGIDASSIVEVNEEEISFDDGSEEMSVAIDLAKLSQGHFSQRELQTGEYKVMSSEQTVNNGSQYVFYTEDGKQAQCLEDIEGRTVHVADTFAKPRMSYAQLIAEALINSSDGMLTLSEIYQAISARHPYYRMDARNWQNSIRHNLTLNKSFNKVPRSSNEGRGSYWKLENGAEANIFKRGSRHLQQAKVRDSSNYHQQTIITGSDHQIIHDGGEVHTSIVQTDSDPAGQSQQVIYVTIPTN